MKTIQVGQKSFIAFIKAFISVNNIVDFYERYSDVEQLPIVLWEQTKRNKIFKISLRSNEIERLHKNYLFYKNDCKPNEHKISFIRFDEFILNIPIKSSYRLFERNNKDFLYCRTMRGGTNNPLLKEFIVIDEFLLYDEKHINLYCFSERTKDSIIKMINKNTVKWYSAKDNEEEYRIINRGMFGTSRNKYEKKYYVEDEEDILNLTLKDVLSVIPTQYNLYGGIHRNRSNMTINERMEEVIYNFDNKIIWINNDEDLKLLFEEHMKNILYTLFQSSDEEETKLEDFYKNVDVDPK